MLYQFLKVILKVAFFFFYKKMIVTGLEKLPKKGPLLVAGNHPNTLMDPLIVAVLTQQRVGFLGNASIFVNALVSVVFHFFHVIPIYRKEDVKPGEKPDNRAAFAAAHNYLRGGGTLLVFPEGTSHYELKLRDIKTGMARIALSYEEQHAFAGGLKIATMSLDYSDSVRFRSVLSVNVGDPIAVADFKAIYEQDEKEGIRTLTEKIRNALAAPIPSTADKAQESFLRHVHQFYTTYCDPGLNLLTDSQASLALRRFFSRKIQPLQNVRKDLYEQLQSQLARYYREIRQKRINPDFFTESFQRKNISWVTFEHLFFLLLGLPVYLLGLVTNYVPYMLPGFIYRKLDIDIEYKTSVSLVGGLVFFPLFYGLSLWVFRSLVSGNFLLSAGALLIFPLTGFFARFYWRKATRFVQLIRYRFALDEKQKKLTIELRDEISKGISAARMLLEGWKRGAS